MGGERKTNSVSDKEPQYGEDIDRVRELFADGKLHLPKEANEISEYGYAHIKRLFCRGILLRTREQLNFNYVEEYRGKKKWCRIRGYAYISAESPLLGQNNTLEWEFKQTEGGTQDTTIEKRLVDEEVYQDFVEWYHFLEKSLGKRPKLWKYNPITGDLVIRRIPLNGNRSFTVNMHRKGTIQVRIACTGFRNEIKTLRELDGTLAVIRGFLSTDKTDEEIKSDWHPARYSPEGVQIETPWFNVGVKVSEVKEYWRMYFTEGRIKNEQIPMETAPLSDLRKKLQINGETKEAIMLLAKQNEVIQRQNASIMQSNEIFGKNLQKHVKAVENISKASEDMSKFTEKGMAVLDGINAGVQKMVELLEKLGKKL